MNSFDVMKEMSANNQNISLTPLTNIEQFQQRKSGWGYIKIAVPNETILKLLNEKVGGGLLVFSAEQFDEIKNRKASGCHVCDDTSNSRYYKNQRYKYCPHCGNGLE